MPSKFWKACYERGRLTARSQLAEQYGDAFASEVLNRSRSKLPLDTAPPMPYTSGNEVPVVRHGHYESLSGGHGSPEDYSGHPKRL